MYKVMNNMKMKLTSLLTTTKECFVSHKALQKLSKKLCFENYLKVK